MNWRVKLKIIKKEMECDIAFKISVSHEISRFVINLICIHYRFVCILNRLREVGMPADYVNKLARMFQDVKVSEDLNQQFKETYRSTKGSIAGEKDNYLICLLLKKIHKKLTFRNKIYEQIQVLEKAPISRHIRMCAPANDW